MKIKEVLTTINQMQSDGIIDRYAIGGAVGATFYLEPIATLDVDIFVAFRPEPGKLLFSPQPLFDYFTARGFQTEGEYFIIADWPVQFLPPPTPLVEEALVEAVSFDIEGVPTRVFSAEHWPASRWNLAARKTKHGCYNSSKRASSTRLGWRPSSSDIICPKNGEDSTSNSYEVKNDSAIE